MTLSVRRAAFLSSLFAILALSSSCHSKKDQEDEQSRQESFEVFKKVFAIGLPGMKDEEIVKVDGVRKLDGSKSSTPGLVLKTDAILTEDPPESLKGVTFNGFSKDGVIISSRIEIEETTEFLEDIKSLVEDHYQIEFPEAEIDEMNMGEITMKTIVYRLEKEGMAYVVSSAEGTLVACSFSIDALPPKQ